MKMFYRKKLSIVSAFLFLVSMNVMAQNTNADSDYNHSKKEKVIVVKFLVPSLQGNHS